MVAISDELAGAKTVRTRDYWLASARKRMRTWHKMMGGKPQTFLQRRLIRYPTAPDTVLMLSLADADDGGWISIYKALLKLTRSNEIVYNKFLKAGSKSVRIRIVREAEAGGRATAPVLDVLQKNAQRL